MQALIHPEQLKGFTAVVVGAGRSGKAAARLLDALGADVRLLEENRDNLSSELSKLAEDMGWELQAGEHSAPQFSAADLVVLSPGVAARKIRPFLPQGKKVQVLSELELSSWFVNEPIIAVTGTNGKTTTTSLISHVLQYMGKKVFTGGNIGPPLAEYLLDKEEADLLILEVSSFQLQNIYTFHPRVALLLNFSPNHLDYHQDIQEYLEAKLQLFKNQNPSDLAILPLNLKPTLERELKTRARQIYFINQRRFSSSVLMGPHNEANMEAAYLACNYFGVQEGDMNAALETFEPPAHRLQPVLEKDGVLFVNDSKATTIDALHAALQSFERPILLLAGGVFKGGDPAQVLELIQEKVKAVALFGQSREIFEQAWSGATEVTWSPTLEEAVQKLRPKAESGDVLLLSPATASFDLFANYKERGQAFCELVSGGECP